MDARPTNLLRRYHAFLRRRATGLSYLGWYPESSLQALPWLAVIMLGVLVGNLAPEPDRLLVTLFFALPGFAGLMVSQLVMIAAHFEDLRSRMKNRG